MQMKCLNFPYFSRLFKPHIVKGYVFSLVDCPYGYFTRESFCEMYLIIACHFIQEPAVSSPKESQTESKIPPKPVMSAEATAYPKLLKIYKELNRQNGIIFDAERERNNLEIERDSLKGLAKLTKKGELQSRIDRKNEEIDLLKTGLSGIVKRYGFQNVQEFYRVYQKAKNAYADYRENTNKWENTYGEKADSKQKSIHERLQNYQKEILGQSTERNIQQKEKGAR